MLTLHSEKKRSAVEVEELWCLLFCFNYFQMLWISSDSLLELAASDQFDALGQYPLNLIQGAMKAAFDSDADTCRI